MTDLRTAGGRLVVGVDGSKGATSAVCWAAQEANIRGAKLELVSVWEVSVSTVGFGLGFSEMSQEMLKRLEQNAEEVLATAAEVAREAFPDLEIETRTMEGSGGGCPRARRTWRGPVGGGLARDGRVR